MASSGVNCEGSMKLDKPAQTETIDILSIGINESPLQELIQRQGWLFTGTCPVVPGTVREVITMPFGWK
jgi:hypothetical protein